jgi:FkbM family methyltransferase
MDDQRGPLVDVRKIVRSGMVHFPWLADRKSGIQYGVHRLLHRPFEVEFLALEGLLSPGDLCLDLGANRGQSIDALKMLPFPVRVIAFEPQGNLYRRLLKRFGSDPDVIVLPFGASDRASMTEIYVPYYGGYCFDGIASIHESSVDEWLRASIYHFDEKKLEIRAMPCRTVRLDDFSFGPVAFIKMDIQGSEYAALEGSVETLRRDRPQLMVETPSPEVRAFLEELGYTQYVYEDGHLRKSSDWTLNPFFLS